VFGGGTNGTVSNVIDYITIATPGNATDFGDLTVARREVASASDGTYSFFAGGNVEGGGNTIDYVTVATPGNATDFGDLTDIRSASPAGCSGN
jgi:hypothetical protein